MLTLLLDLQDLFKVLLGFLFALLAFNYQENRKENKERLKALQAFYREIRLNRLSAKVMIGAENFALLDQQCLTLIKFNPTIPLEKTVMFYALEIVSVNNIISDYLIAKEHYTIAYQNRTPEDANTLNSKRVRVIDSLNDFAVSMEEAEKIIKSELTKLNLIKSSLPLRARMVKNEKVVESGGVRPGQ